MNQRLKQGCIGLVFSATIFLGAFLLFQVQPLIGRFLLPWFGGTPQVWTTCMLFFQVFLLGGYLYAHALVKVKSLRLQSALHIGLLVLALCCLPIIPEDVFKPTGQTPPILQILLICSVTVGLPYFLLAATSPLIQVWFHRSFVNRNPYRLYALSNMGSLLALGTFPFVFEPLMSRRGMAYMWSGAFVVFIALCTTAVILGQRRSNQPPTSNPGSISEDKSQVRIRNKWMWLGLSAVAVVELLAVTDKITQDIAVIPFLWVLPLSLYLLSFIICFEHQRWYKRWLFIPLFILSIIGVIIAPLYEQNVDFVDIRILIVLYAFMLFNCCMVCHGELYRLRPAPKHLTGYYLTISTGGALGGFFVAVICPLIFNQYIELHLGLLVCALFLVLGEQNLPTAQAKRRPYWVVALCIIGVISIMMMGKHTVANHRGIAGCRNFFGVLNIWEEDWQDPAEHKLLMQHGTTFHGLQFTDPELRDIPTAYYSPESGIGIVMQNWPQQHERRIGIIGLGVGTIAIYGNENDLIRFYEINPDVERMARTYFTYLNDSKAEVQVVLGDGRLVMESESPQQYDILVLDAFSSDSVPLHLLTTQAMEIYLKHLAPDGVMAFHISTMYLDLQSIVWKMAEHFDLQSAWIESVEDTTPGALASDWILLARNNAFLESDPITKIQSRPRAHLENVPLWTDDHINLFKVLKKLP